MGLSGRRRAKKETTQGQPSIPDGDLITAEPQHRAGPHQRTGNTHRRVFPDAARQRKRTNLLAFKVKRGFRDDLLPPMQPSHPVIAFGAPNANRNSRSMIRIMDNDYSCSVTYSLNKRSRWGFTEQLRSEYDTCDELKAQNLLLIESLARGRRSAAVRSLTTNGSYIVEAAAELREHKKKLQVKSSSRPKQHVMQNDRFEFSDRVTQGQTDRPLTSTVADSRGGAINATSIRRSQNLWNNLYNVSPSAEQVRLSMQRDFDGRTEVVVGTTVPCPGVDTKRMRQCQKDNQVDKRFGNKTQKNFPYNQPRLIERMVKQIRRSELQLQLELDGNVQEISQDTAENDDTECEMLSVLNRPVATLFDAMRPMEEVSANRTKKLAMKAQKMMKTKRQLSQKKKRSDSDQTLGSSGYDSGSEYRDGVEVSDAMEKETETVDARLTEAVNAALAVERPTVCVSREKSDAARLINMFAVCGAERALVLGNSLPRKLAILLQSDLSETVVFQEVAQDDPAFTTFAVHHVCSGDWTPRTSAQEVTSQEDPFAFLCSLIAASSVRAQKTPEAEGTEEAMVAAASGWRRADVLTEAEARVTAVRALSMFSVTAGDADTHDAELVPSSECEICCQPLSLDAQHLQTSGAFADGSTMLIECGHHFCNRCWLLHVASSVARGRADVACAGHKCQSALDAATLLCFCPSELLPALTAAAFRAWLTDRRDRRERRFCPQAKCGRLLQCRSGVNAVCGVCSRGLCLGCGQEPHWPTDCATAAQYRKRMEHLGHVKLSLRDLQAEADVNAKQCPTCQLIMEKGVGCNHMTCPCGEHFCWWCGQAMRTHPSGPCTSSARNQSGYRIQRVFTAKDSFLVPNSSQSRMYCEAMKIRLFREAAPHRLNVAIPQIADLFASYAVRFHAGGSCSWQDAKREAKRTSRQLIEVIIQASYLVEYSYAYLDCHRGDRRAKTAVRAIGGHIGQLVETVTSEIREQSRSGYLGPKHTKVTCERLLMLQHCLQSKCRLLHKIVVARRDNRLVAKATAEK